MEEVRSHRKKRPRGTSLPNHSFRKGEDDDDSAWSSCLPGCGDKKKHSRIESSPISSSSSSAQRNLLLDENSHPLYDDPSTGDKSSFSHMNTDTFLFPATTSKMSPTTASSARSILFAEDDRNVGECADDGVDENKSDQIASSINAPATRFTDKHIVDRIQTITSSSNNSSSLFGAVMKNVAPDTRMADPSTGYSQSVRPTTPAKNIARASVFSPGGFQLQDFVNGFGNSPFVVKDKMIKQQYSPTFTPTPSSSTNPTSEYASNDATSRRIDEWHECCIDHGLIDWSIKERLQFEFTPGHVVPQLLAESDTWIEQNALRHFVGGCRIVDDGSIRTAATYWNASLLFWQHPDAPVQQTTMAVTTNNNTASSKSKQAESSEPLSYGQDASCSFWPTFDDRPQPHKLQQQAFTILNGNNDPVDSDPTSYWDTRIMEWRQAFNSLYSIWIMRIRSYRQQSVEDNRTLLDTCFYSIGQGHTVLFRIGLEDFSDTATSLGKDQVTDTRFVPEIVLPTSTLMLRDKLRSMGIHLRILNKWLSMNRGSEFDEQVLVRSMSTTTSIRNKMQSLNDENSPNIKAELIALRQAQIYGLTVGADVSVNIYSSKSKTQGASKSTKEVPPLYISGFDDCAAFMEVYYNMCGQIGTNIAATTTTAATTTSPSANPTQDIPILLCRKLGPFLHATIKRVQSYSRSYQKFACSHIDNLPASMPVDLQGYLLPCAVRDLINASVHVMQAEANYVPSESSTNESTPKLKLEAIQIGTHHFTVQPTLYRGGCYASSLTGTIGLHSSRGLNGEWSLLSNSTRLIDYCRHDELLQVAVWDIAHAKSLAYKVEHITTSTIDNKFPHENGSKTHSISTGNTI